VAALGEDGKAVLGRSIAHGRGCIACKQTGYMGRTAVFEVMPLSKPVRRLVLDGLNEDQIKQSALHDGFMTLRKAGLNKVIDGLTTIEEIRSATLADHV